MSDIIEIKTGEWSAKINLTRGANCLSLRNKHYGARIIREPENYSNPENPYTYGMPILFPVNRIEGGAFEFEGRKYVFPINEVRTGCHLHGELHIMPFEVSERKDNYQKCRYSAKSGEYLGFPHSFEITQEYELKENGLFHTVTVTNLSGENMPIFLGFHTTFNTCFTDKSRGENMRVFVDISEEYERNVAVNYLPTGVKPDFDGVSSALLNGSFSPYEMKISRHYRANGKMSITDLENRLRVVYDNDEKYGFRLIYNGGDEGYICLEPQTCLANCQNSPFSREEGGFDYIAPGASKKYKSAILLEEI